jgi:hypothetical protein
MAIDLINLGTAPNDGTGDSLRDGGEKVNSNLSSLFNVNGWAYYKDSLATTATQVFGSSPTQLLIDGLGATSESGYLPYSIRGVSELWSGNSIKPINLGDSYQLRIDLTITATSSNPTRLNLNLDIGDEPTGGGGSGSILIVEDSKTLKTGTPQKLVFSFPIFSLATFLANDGTIFLSADSGTVTVEDRAIMISQISSGAL